MKQSQLLTLPDWHREAKTCASAPGLGWLLIGGSDLAGEKPNNLTILSPSGLLSALAWGWALAS